MSNVDLLRDSGTFQRHISRLRASLSAHSPATICEFLEKHTNLKGKSFTFDGHSYQKTILEDPAQDIVIIKSAQLGISEMSARMTLARCALIEGFSAIYTLPSASAAQNFMKTRIDPIISESPYLSEIVSNTLDNTSIKQLGLSYMYLKGCQVERQALSVPADLLVSDETDASNQEVMTTFESRLIHSKYAMTIKLSTPSLPNYGIDKFFKQSKRKMNFCKCSKCAQWFYPDYYEHVKIPNFDEDLSKITKKHFADPGFLWQEAFVACPHCGTPADLSPEHREWVCENPEANFPASGYRISPFDCPTFIKTSALVKASTEYESHTQFANQRLGLPHEDRESTLAREDLANCLINNGPGGIFSYVFGLDMGTTCWMTIAAALPDNTMIIVKIIPVPLFEVLDKVPKIARSYRIRMGVIDHGPYTETVWQLQKLLQNTFAGVYTNSNKGIDIFRIKDQEEDKEKGRETVRQVNIARDRGFDLVMHMVRAKQIMKVSDELDELWMEHLTDQKRVREFRNDELVFVWRKTQGIDHMHHSVLYALVASRIMGTASGPGLQLPMLSTFSTAKKTNRT